MRVGCARVSTTDQSPELQFDALRRSDCEKTFTDKASGAKADRPELARFLHDVLRRGDVLVVWKPDQLARSLKKLITSGENLEERGIGLVSLTESIDTTKPGGVLVFHVFGAIAQFERALIRERTAAGLAEARRRGRRRASPDTQGGRHPRGACPDEGRQAAGAQRGQAHGRVDRHPLPPCWKARREGRRRERLRGTWLTARSGRQARRWLICGGVWPCCCRAIPPGPR